MRVVEQDAKLGVTKVIWKFAQEPDPFKGSAVLMEAPPPAETVDEPFVPETESPEQEPYQSEPAVGLTDTDSKADPALSDPHLTDLRQQIRFLQQIIENQNQQLQSKDELIRNFQVLLKTEQDQVLKLEAARAQDSVGEPRSAEPQGWFRFFRRGKEKQ